MVFLGLPLAQENPKTSHQAIHVSHIYTQLSRWKIQEIMQIDHTWMVWYGLQVYQNPPRRDRIDAAQSLHLDFFGHFFSEAMNPPAALPAKRPFLELLTAARLRKLWGVQFPCSDGKTHLIFSSVMMGHEGSTAQFTSKKYVKHGVSFS